MTDQHPAPPVSDDDLALHALGVLEGDDLARVEAALRTDPALAARLAVYQEASWGLAASVDPVPPPPALRDRVLDAIATTPQLPARANPEPAPAAAPDPAPQILPLPVPDPASRPGSGPWRWVAALAAALALTLGIVSVVQVALLADARAGRDASQQVLAAVARGEGIPLRAAGDVPVSGTLVPVAEGRAFLALAAPPPPDGRVYQLWFLGEGAPVPSVTVAPGTGGTALVPVPLDRVPGGIAVTLEPAGGSSSPTLPILAQGTAPS